MPLQACSVDGTDGWRWGAQGKCYTGPDAKQKALAQGIAMGDIDTGGKATGQKTAGPVLLSVKFAEERREATGVVAKAFDGTPDSLDLDGEAMDPADVFKLVRSYMLGGKLRGHAGRLGLGRLGRASRYARFELGQRSAEVVDRGRRTAAAAAVQCIEISLLLCHPDARCPLPAFCRTR